MNALNEMEPPDDAPRIQRVALPSRDQVTSVQMHTLLNAAQLLNSMVVSRSASEEVDGAEDGGVNAAVDAVIIRICGQLEKMVEDQDRWDLKNQRSLEGQLEKIYAANLDLISTQKTAVIETTAPHTRGGVGLMKVETGEWVAILGNPKDLDNCIVGIGSSPAEALQDFDKVFNGAKSKLQTENEQSPKVDNSGTEQSQGTSNTSSQDLGPNSNDPGEDSGIGAVGNPPI